MGLLLGIDLGTSGVRAVVTNPSGKLIRAAGRSVAILAPRPGLAEQRPGAWWEATVQAVREATSGIGDSVRALSLAGQMHGTVLLDAAGKPLGNAIIWADGRSTEEAEEMSTIFGQESFVRLTGTAPFTGFMGPTLLWLKRREPARLEATRAAILPKDYLRFELTGEVATDPTDASSTALFDVRNRRWSTRTIRSLGLPEDLFPAVVEPADPAGELRRAAALELGLPPFIPVAAGCADQAAQALANGLLDPGRASLTLGSGGQILAPLAAIPAVPSPLHHVFCHAPSDRWYIMGAMLNAGLSLRWLRDTLGLPGGKSGFALLSRMASEAPAGSDGLLFLPYLSGERTPLMDPRARGCFIGLSLRHGRGHLARSVMEGVGFALRQVVESVEAAGVHFPVLLASGGGLSDPLWRRIIADILNRTLTTIDRREQTGLGAALLAGICAGTLDGYDELRERADRLESAVSPPTRSGIYEENYRRFIALYPRLRPLMRRL